MTTAGFGDTIAKHQSNGDWVMNHLLLSGEYHCRFCAGIVGDIEPLYLDHPEDIREGRPEAIQGLFEALFWTGMAMTLDGHQRPGQRRRAPPEPHAGHDGRGARREPRPARPAGRHRHGAFGRSVREGAGHREPRSAGPAARVDERFLVVPSVASAVREQYEAKRQRLELDPGEDRAAERLGSTQDGGGRRGEESGDDPHLAAACRRGRLSMADIGCSRERIRSAILHMHEIRKRFTIIDLAWLRASCPLPPTTSSTSGCVSRSTHRFTSAILR